MTQAPDDLTPVRVEPTCYTDGPSGIGLLMFRLSQAGRDDLRVARWVRLRHVYGLTGKPEPLPSNLWIQDFFGEPQVARSLASLEIPVSWASFNPLLWDLLLTDLLSYQKDTTRKLQRACKGMGPEEWPGIVARSLADEARTL